MLKQTRNNTEEVVKSKLRENGPINLPSFVVRKLAVPVLKLPVQHHGLANCAASYSARH